MCVCINQVKLTEFGNRLDVGGKVEGGVKLGYQVSDWITGLMAVSFHWDTEHWKRTRVLNEDCKFTFGHVDFESPLRHQRADVKMLII